MAEFIDMQISGAAIIKEREYNTPVRQAIREALLIAVERLVNLDNIMDDHFTLRFETFGDQVQAILERHKEN